MNRKKIFVVFLVFFLFAIVSVAGAASFGGRASIRYGIDCPGRNVFTVTKSGGRGYMYPFASYKGLNTGNKVIGFYRTTMVCHTDDETRTPVTVYSVDKMGVSR